jgi:hypothetical protein
MERRDRYGNQQGQLIPVEMIAGVQGKGIMRAKWLRVR